MEIKKTLTAMAFQAVFAALVVAGFIYGIEGAQYAIKFFIWVIAWPVSIIAVTETMKKKLASEPKNHAAARYSARIVAWATLGILVWTGNVFTASVWITHMFLMAISREQINKLRDAAEPATVDG